MWRREMKVVKDRSQIPSVTIHSLCPLASADTLAKGGTLSNGIAQMFIPVGFGSLVGIVLMGLLQFSTDQDYYEF